MENRPTAVCTLSPVAFNYSLTSPRAFSFPPSSLCPFHRSLLSLPLPLGCLFTLRLHVCLSCPNQPIVLLNPRLLSLLLPCLLPHFLCPSLLNSTSLTYSFSFPLSSCLFLMCFPKDWWLFSTRWVGLFKDAWGNKAKFSPPPLSSPPSLNSFHWRQEPPLRVASYWSREVQRPPPNQTSLLSRWLSVTYDDQPADSVINDAAEELRLIKGQKKAGSHRYDDAPNRQGEECGSLMLSVMRINIEKSFKDNLSWNCRNDKWYKMNKLSD